MTGPAGIPRSCGSGPSGLVFEHQGEHPSQWAAITSIAHKFGVSAETLRKWSVGSRPMTGSGQD